MADAWSPFYWGDYGRKTAHLTLMDHGAYLLLMSHYYSTGRPLDAIASVLHRVCRCYDDAERGACDRVLAQFFEREGDFFHHRRIDQELAKSREKSEIRRNVANKRWQKITPKSADAKALQLHTQPQYTDAPLLACAKQIKSESAKGSRIPKDFCVKEEHRTWAWAHKMPKPEDHIDAFVDYWSGKPGKAGMKLDWDATFRNWLRNTKPNGNGGNGNGYKKTGLASFFDEYAKTGSAVAD